MLIFNAASVFFPKAAKGRLHFGYIGRVIYAKMFTEGKQMCTCSTCSTCMDINLYDSLTKDDRELLFPDCVGLCLSGRSVMLL